MPTDLTLPSASASLPHIQACCTPHVLEMRILRFVEASEVKRFVPYTTVLEVHCHRSLGQNNYFFEKWVGSSWTSIFHRIWVMILEVLLRVDVLVKRKKRQTKTSINFHRRNSKYRQLIVIHRRRCRVQAFTNASLSMADRPTRFTLPSRANASATLSNTIFSSKLTLLFSSIPSIVFSFGIISSRLVCFELPNEEE